MAVGYPDILVSLLCRDINETEFFPSLRLFEISGGVDSLLNALDADRELFNAELSLAQTRRNEWLSLVQLYKVLAGSWQQ